MRCCIGARVLVFALFSAGSALALATGGISGVVTDARTQAPVAKARGPPRGGAARPTDAVADEQGAFEIARLPDQPSSPSNAKGPEARLQQVVVESPRDQGAAQLVPLPAEPLTEGQPAIARPAYRIQRSDAAVLISGPPEYALGAREAVEGDGDPLRDTVDGTMHGCRVIKELATIAPPSLRSSGASRRCGPAGGVYYTFNLALRCPEVLDRKRVDARPGKA
jgi:hypothetical protein